MIKKRRLTYFSAALVFIIMKVLAITNVISYSFDVVSEIILWFGMLMGTLYQSRALKKLIVTTHNRSMRSIRSGEAEGDGGVVGASTSSRRTTTAAGGGRTTAGLPRKTRTSKTTPTTSSSTMTAKEDNHSRHSSTTNTTSRASHHSKKGSSARNSSTRVDVANDAIIRLQTFSNRIAFFGVAGLVFYATAEAATPFPSVAYCVLDIFVKLSLLGLSLWYVIS